MPFQSKMLQKESNNSGQSTYATIHLSSLGCDGSCMGKLSSPGILFSNNMLQLVGSQSALGPARRCNSTSGSWVCPSGLLLVGQAWNNAKRRRPMERSFQVPESPQLASLNVMEQQVNTELLLNLLNSSHKWTPATFQTNLILISCGCDPSFMASNLVTGVSVKAEVVQ